MRKGKEVSHYSESGQASKKHFKLNEARSMFHMINRMSIVINKPD